MASCADGPRGGSGDADARRVRDEEKGSVPVSAVQMRRVALLALTTDQS
jgi:hypothetical protein